jgi:DNA repair exonuclease SbcCD ATPase subunit
MITALEIQNFQSHEKSILEFDSGVNIIIGASDSGKTAIIRAMRWCIWNRPSGATLCSSWGGNTSVKLDTDEGNFVIRSKDKADKYTSHVSGEENLEYKAFGTSVPEEISNLLNISEINLQRQLDTPFLLSETAGDVAKHFNLIAKLDKIDTSTSKINSAIRDLASTIKYTEAQEVTQLENLGDYDHLEKAEIDLEVLEEMEGRLKGMKTAREKLFALCLEYQEVDCAILFESDLLQFEKPIDDILALKTKLKLLNLDRALLQVHLDRIRNTDRHIKQNDKILTTETLIISLLSLMEKRKTAYKDRNKLFLLLESIKRINTYILTSATTYAALQAKFGKEFPDVCPLCNKPK